MLMSIVFEMYILSLIMYSYPRPRDAMRQFQKYVMPRKGIRSFIDDLHAEYFVFSTRETVSLQNIDERMTFCVICRLVVISIFS